jgi:menaquinone-dependent protoporphyrinogen oxidase
MDTASPSSFPPRRPLVAFATEHGSTVRSPEPSGPVCPRRASRSDVLPMEQVERIDDYHAVVVGSGVYMNRWLKPGTDFLKRFRRLRAASRPRRRARLRRRPRGRRKWLDRLGARGHVTFPGRIGDDMTGPLERWMARGDWGAIQAWA